MSTETPVDAAVGALRRAVDEDREREASAAYEVGFERGFVAGWRAAERESGCGDDAAA